MILALRVLYWILKSPKEVATSYLRGSLFETAIIADLYKQYCNLDIPPVGLHFFRTQAGEEVDAVIDKAPHPIAIEVKAGTTITPDSFKGVRGWQSLLKTSQGSDYLVYGGQDSTTWPDARVIGWSSAGELVQSILALEE